jgi:hypothetical protein
MSNKFKVGDLIKHKEASACYLICGSNNNFYRLKVKNDNLYGNLSYELKSPKSYINENYKLVKESETEKDIEEWLK